MALAPLLGAGAIEAEGVGLPGSDVEIELYPTRGNHEGYHFTMTKEEVEEAWFRNMGYAVPANGPEGEVGFTYSFLHEGDLFMGLEVYVYSDSMMISGIQVNQGLKSRTRTTSRKTERKMRPPQVPNREWNPRAR